MNIARSLLILLTVGMTATFAQDKKPDGGQKPGATFFGDEIISKRVIFIIDRSGSMAEKSDWKPELETGGGGGSGEKLEGDKKIDVAKFELKRAIRGLASDAVFTIITYSDEPTVWKEELVPATQGNKDEAIKFVDAIAAKGGTNIYDPVEKAYKMKPSAAAAAVKKPVKQSTTISDLPHGADTLYLLSDGLPNRGQITDPTEIRARVKEMNKEAMMTINTVGVGRDANEDFMKGLATDTGGKYLKR